MDIEEAAFDTSILSSNLDLLMKRAGVSANSLANIIGLPATSIKRIRSNAQPNPTLATLLPLARYFNVSLNQLIGICPLDTANNDQTRYSSYLAQVPILDWADILKWQNNEFKLANLNYLTVALPYTGRHYAIKINENMGRFSKDTFLIIEKKSTIKHQDYIILAKDEHAKASLKLALLEDDQIYVKSLTVDIPATCMTPECNYLGTVILTISYF